MGESRLADDRYDELRRAWIASRQGLSMIQRRRAERLGRRIRMRQRAVAVAVPDPHDDTTIPPLWLRSAKSPCAQLEFVAVLVLGIVMPLGWLGGMVLEHIVVRCIPTGIRSYPIVGLTWSGVGLGAILIAFEGFGSSNPSGVALIWWCLQVVAVPAVAGALGMLNGWPAVPGSDHWWPLARPRSALSATDAADILRGLDTTAPDLIQARQLNPVGETSRW